MHPYEVRQGQANVELARLYARYARALRDYQDAVRRGVRGVSWATYMKRLRLAAVALCEHYPEVLEARRWAAAVATN